MNRIKLFQIIIAIIAVLIIIRLFYWQFISDISIGSDAFLKETEIPASRGEIYASDNFPLVANQEAFLIYGKPHELNQPVTDIAKKLAPNLISPKYATVSAGLSEAESQKKDQEIKDKEEELSSKLENKNLYWVQLARKVPSAIYKNIQNMKIQGLGFEKDEKRNYPEASMAAQLLGFVGYNKFGQDTGYFGLEGFWDRILKGKSGRLGQEQDPFGLPILIGKYQPIKPKKGSSLYLSIDRSIQFIVENELKNAVIKYGAKQGTIIVANPSNGRILAMATYPTYEPEFRLEFDENLYKNPAVADNFEPGSIFKLITMSAALDSSVIEPDTRCSCNGPRQIGGFEISTWNKKYYPNSTMTEVIQHSDNVGMTFVAEKLGLNKFYEYILKFGFSKATSIDLQGESDGSIRPKNEWREVDLATASFGQGIAITPIQMVQAASVIANGGKLIKPSIVVKIKNSSKEEILQTDEGRRIISQKTAAQVKEMMVNAVQNGETKAFAPKDLRIAGKTGTAQVPVAGHYDPNKTIASFIGFAPADEPKFVMLVRFSQPSSSPYGSETAAPTFFIIAKKLFNYFGIPLSN